jgi:hypothetical protein
VALSRGTRVHGALPTRRRSATGGGQFGLDVRNWVEKAKGRGDIVVQKVSIDLLRSVLEGSPVGNPELWAANASSVYGRLTYNLFVDAQNADAERYNAGLASRGESAFSGTRLIGAIKPVKRAGKKRLANMFPIRSGKDYVGGRFKGNWQVSINGRPVGETGRVDASGDHTLAAGMAVAHKAIAGHTIFIQNNVPYAIPLEYGHSKQAPAGMVRITVARFQLIVDQAAVEAKAEIP